MTEKRSKYDTDPLDPDFVRRTEEISEEMSRGTSQMGGEQQTVPLREDPALNEPTRRFDEQVSDSYPSVFVPPAYQAPPPPQYQTPPRPQPFTTFGAGPAGSEPPATSIPPGPASPYHPPPQAAPGSRKVTKLGLPENVTTALPYAPFYIGLVFSLIALLIVPRDETRVRFHAAQGLALQLAILAGTFAFKIVGAITDSGLGGFLFWVASFVFLIVSMRRVWQGKPHHIAPLDDATAWLSDKFKPMQ